MSNIDSFISHFNRHKGYSLAHRFKVSILTCPVRVKDRLDSLSFQCEATNLPGYNINTVDGKAYGASFPVAATPAYEDIQLTFICSGDMWEKKVFEDWLNFILPQNNYLLKYRDQYAGIINIQKYDDKNNTVYAATLFDAFPNSISPISLNWADSEVSRLQVNIKYRNFKFAYGSDSPAGNLTPSPGDIQGFLDQQKAQTSAPPPEARYADGPTYFLGLEIFKGGQGLE